MQQWLYRKVIWGGIVGAGIGDIPPLRIRGHDLSHVSPVGIGIIGIGKTGTPPYRHRTAGLGHQLHLATEPQWSTR